MSRCFPPPPSPHPPHKLFVVAFASKLFSQPAVSTLRGVNYKNKLDSKCSLRCTDLTFWVHNSRSSVVKEHKLLRFRRVVNRFLNLVKPCPQSGNPGMHIFSQNQQLVILSMSVEWTHRLISSLIYLSLSF